MSVETVFVIMAALAVLSIVLSFKYGFPSPWMVLGGAGGYVVGFYLLQRWGVSETATVDVAAFPIPVGIMWDFTIGYFAGVLGAYVGGIARG